jgi:hypothetical protein
MGQDFSDQFIEIHPVSVCTGRADIEGDVADCSEPWKTLDGGSHASLEGVLMGGAGDAPRTCEFLHDAPGVSGGRRKRLFNERVKPGIGCQFRERNVGIGRGADVNDVCGSCLQGLS